jgi:hypothetical protein
MTPVKEARWNSTSRPTQTLSEVGLLDADYVTTVEVVYKTSSGMLTKKNVQVPNNGDNSYQALSIDKPDVKQVKVVTERSIAVTSIAFCHSH